MADSLFDLELPDDGDRVSLIGASTEEPSSRAPKSPCKTMDEKGANTFLFIIYPPNLRNNLKGLSCSFQPFLLDKRKVSGDTC